MSNDDKQDRNQAKPKRQTTRQTIRQIRALSRLAEYAAAKAIQYRRLEIAALINQHERHQVLEGARK